MKGKKKESATKGNQEPESHTPSTTPEESDPRKQPKPKTGGISREKYRQGIEKAVKDIHG